MKRVINVVPVTISLPTELIKRARGAGIVVSKVCRDTLEARLAGETVHPSELVSRIAQLEYHVGKLLDWRNRVKE